MSKRFLLSIAMLAVGAAMLAAASIASPGASHKRTAPQSHVAKNGGTFHATLQTDIENIDPARSYYVPEWQYEWMTGRMLLSYTHAQGNKGYRLFNDGITKYTVSKDGKTYTFFIRHGMKFSDGKPVTAANFKWAYTRILSPKVQSPIASFLTDPASVNIVGALAYNSGQSSSIPGLQTKGKYKFIMKLEHSSPLLLSLVAFPDAMAQPTGFPLEPITRVPFGSFNSLPSAGPYYVSSRTPNRSIVIKRNKYYKGPVPHHIAQWNYTAQIQADQAFLLINSSQSDWAADGLAPAVYAGLGQKYGTTKGRFRVVPSSCVYYASLNTARSTFGNLNARKAVNYGIDRNQLVRLGGAFSGTPTDQVLTPPIPGYKNVNIYPNKRNVAKAKSLARGHTGHINLWHSSSASSIQISQLVTQWLKEIGFNNIDDKTVSSGLFTQMGKKGTDYDLARIGWCADFPDPYDYLNKLLSGNTIQDAQNNNTAYLNIPKVNNQLNAAARLRPPKRYKVYGNLDVSIMKNYAPWAPYAIGNDREFFSSRVDTKSIRTNPVYELDLAQFALK
jgi:peptide/nickel transport system substrate-binding protein